MACGGRHLRTYLLPVGVEGLAQRTYWIAVLAWLLFVALRLREIGPYQHSSMEV